MNNVQNKILKYKNKVLILSNNIDNEISKMINDNLKNSHSYKRNIFTFVRTLIEFLYKIIYLNKNQNLEKLENEQEILKQSKIFFDGKHDFFEIKKILNCSQSYFVHSIIDDHGINIIYYKYLEYLIYLKKFFMIELELDIIKKIDLLINFTSNKNNDDEYLALVFKKINLTENSFNFKKKGNFTVIRSIPKFYDNRIFYEITLSLHSEKNLKNNRFIVFSKENIQTKYPIDISILEDYIYFKDIKSPLFLVKDYTINIPLSSINYMLKIFGYSETIENNDKQYHKLLKIINDKKINLIDFIDDESLMNCLKEEIGEWCFLNLLIKAREMNIKKEPGLNVIRYLLYTMKISVIKDQKFDVKNIYLSNLYLINKSIPFDKMPIASSLYKHNPSIYDLINCIDLSNREHEFFNKLIIRKCLESNSIYINKKDLDFKNHDKLVCKFNSELSKSDSQQERKIMKYKNFYFIYSMEKTLLEIVDNIKKLASNKNENILKKGNFKDTNFDCEEKEKIINNLFDESSISIIYGDPGTGKSKLIGHISDLYSDNKKIFLTHTNSANESLKRKIKTKNSDFLTIKRFLLSPQECEILIIDECSVVSNKDILNILKNKFNFLILVGDKNQIGSIQFGNWVLIIDSFIPKKMVFNLNKNYRTMNHDLKILWEKAKDNKNDLLEYIVDKEYHSNINDNLFSEITWKDKIVLCFNYDGFYGINNINNIFQSKNKNNIFKIGILGFKVDDPIIFIESDSNILHNNLKGVIKKIEKNNKKIIFEILIDKEIHECYEENINIKEIQNKKTLIQFFVDISSTKKEGIFLPFQLGYAISIHKAQGLEYDHVDLIIPNYIEERISHKIFYTAITRAKSDLKIFLFENSRMKMTSLFYKQKSIKDVSIIKNKLKNKVDF